MSKKKDADFVSIVTLAGEFADYSELQSYCDTQYTTIDLLNKENHDLKLKVKHLEELLVATNKLTDDVVKIEVTPEQAICEIQIQKLQDKASQRELTLEETKRLEILVKSLYLIKEKTGTAISADFVALPAHTPLAQLEQIAATPDAQTPSE